MDNFHIDITSRGIDPLKSALSLCGHKKVSGYRVEETKGKPRMIFYWASSPNAAPFPFEMPIDQAAQFAQAWLDGGAEYGREPDHDGHNEKGFRLYCEDWGHVAGEWQAFVAIEPAWAMYGK